MKRFRNLLLLLFIGIFLFGCDTLGYIALENKSSYPVYYETYYHKDSTNINNDINIRLDTESPNANILFGFGHSWNKNTLLFISLFIYGCSSSSLLSQQEKSDKKEIEEMRIEKEGCDSQEALRLADSAP